MAQFSLVNAIGIWRKDCSVNFSTECYQVVRKKISFCVNVLPNPAYLAMYQNWREVCGDKQAHSLCQTPNQFPFFQKESKTRDFVTNSELVPIYTCLKSLVNEDTLLPMMFLGLRKLGNICWGHKMFLNKIRNIFASRTQKVVSATNVARAGKRGNICVGNNVSSFAMALN